MFILLTVCCNCLKNIQEDNILYLKIRKMIAHRPWLKGEKYIVLYEIMSKIAFCQLLSQWTKQTHVFLEVEIFLYQILMDQKTNWNACREVKFKRALKLQFWLISKNLFCPLSYHKALKWSIYDWTIHQKAPNFLFWHEKLIESWFLKICGKQTKWISRVQI